MQCVICCTHSEVLHATMQQLLHNQSNVLDITICPSSYCNELGAGGVKIRVLDLHALCRFVQPTAEVLLL